MTCPNCRRVQYFTCSNRACQCWRRVPKGKSAQRRRGRNVVVCPYCGFGRHIEFWFDREMRALKRSDPASDAEAHDEPTA